MEKFLATGVHPEVERARLAQQDIIPPLPERSTQRQHAFLDIAVNSKAQGKQGGQAPELRREKAACTPRLPVVMDACCRCTLCLLATGGDLVCLPRVLPTACRAYGHRTV